MRISYSTSKQNHNDNKLAQGFLIHIFNTYNYETYNNPKIMLYFFLCIKTQCGTYLVPKGINIFFTIRPSYVDNGSPYEHHSLNRDIILYDNDDKSFTFVVESMCFKHLDSVGTPAILQKLFCNDKDDFSTLHWINLILGESLYR